MRKAIVRDSFVENVIEITQEVIDGEPLILTDGAIEYMVIDHLPPYKPPEGCILMDADGAGPGDTWDGSKFITPEPVPPEPSRLDILEGRIKALEKAT